MMCGLTCPNYKEIGNERMYFYCVFAKIKDLLVANLKPIKFVYFGLKIDK